MLRELEEDAHVAGRTPKDREAWFPVKADTVPTSTSHHQSVLFKEREEKK